jgi:hypothetical protein
MAPIQALEHAINLRMSESLAVAVGFIASGVLQVHTTLIFHHRIERDLEHLVKPVFLLEVVGD